MIIDKTIEDLLIREGVLTKEQLGRAMAEHRRTKENLTSIIERLGFSTEEKMIKCISANYEIPYEEITKEYVKPEVIGLIKPELARKFKTIPVNLIANQLTVATSDPLNLLALDSFSFASGKKIKPIISKESTINGLIDHFFGKEKKMQMQESLEDLVEEGFYYYSSEEKSEQVEVDANAAPVVRLVNIIISQAIKMRASDIHIEGNKKDVTVRFRIDGILREMNSLPKKMQPSIIARIKVMSRIDIAERVRPQDGRFFITMNNGKEVDFRVSTYSTIYGESAVIRILDQSKAEVKLTNLGLNRKEEESILSVSKRSSGMIIVCGPTGSGKTTTLYAILNEVNSVEKKIITIEDPVEYRLTMVNQIPINPRRGLQFETVLRAALRQDPDIILVGEIRDTETARIAIQASLTGHLLLSTLHTTSPAEAFNRLIEMGIERYYVGDGISMVIGQRLVRTICQKCKESYKPSMDELLGLGIKGDEREMIFYNSPGCDYCDYVGYKGVTGVFEVINVNDDLRQMILDNETPDGIKREARRHGMVTMWENAIGKILEGKITSKDVMKIIPRE